MKNIVIATLLLQDGTYSVGVDNKKVENKNPIKNRHIAVELKTRVKRFYTGQEVKHQGEIYTIQKISRNGWVKFVGVTNQTKIKNIEAVKKEYEEYYGTLSNEEISKEIKCRLKLLQEGNAIYLIMNRKRILREIEILNNTIF